MPTPHPLPGGDVLVDGPAGPVRLHVVDHGSDRAGRLPVLLVHGLPTSSVLWSETARDLGHRHRCLAPDLLGLGRSEREPAGGLALHRQAEVLRALLDRLGVARAVVVGSDVGGAVAVLLAAAHPERVAGLVLVDAPLHVDVWPPPGVLPLLAPVLGPAVARLLPSVPGLARRALARALGGLPEPLARAHLAPLLEPGAAAALRAFVRAVDPSRVEEAWRQLRARPLPALVLWGRGDAALSTAYARRLAGELPGASLVVVEDAGHLLPHARPERVAEEVAAFAAELDG